MTRGGKRFYITFIDDYSRYTRVYLLRNKDEARDAFIKYKNEVENQLTKVLLPEPKKRKLGPKIFDVMFIGYVENSAAYRSKRDRKETNLEDGFYTFLIDEDPKSYKETITFPDVPFWKEAINSEINSIMYNHTWELVDLPPSAKTIGSSNNLVVHQMDVKTAFLNGDLEEKIYMDQPEGYVVPGKEKNCIYNKHEDNTCVVICLYVDDMLIFGTSLEVVCETKKFIGSKFDMKDLGEAKVILGIKITRTPNGLKLSQEHYVKKILRKFEHFDCKPVSTLYDPSSQLKKNREHRSVIYLMNCTRPDIAYAVVSWKSAKQTCITRSIMEVEFIVLEKASSEAEWLRNLLANIPLWTRPTPSVSMCCDSQAAIAKVKSKIFNGKNKHIRLRHNIV
ncbi:hypothetical protein AAG906_007972 [Vitis piasezkii]